MPLPCWGYLGLRRQNIQTSVTAKCCSSQAKTPDDVRMRWIKLLDDMKVNPDEVDVFFVPGSFALSDKALRDQIKNASEANGLFHSLSSIHRPLSSKATTKILIRR
jgi:hypothetical protein